MESNHRAVKKYLRRVKRLLICGATSREQIHNRALSVVEMFAEENPEADYAAYVKAFGKPEDFAADILSVLDEHEVENAKRRAKRKKIAIICACGILIIAVLGYLVSHYLHAQEIVNGDFLVVEETPQVKTQTDTEQFLTEGDID